MLRKCYDCIDRRYIGGRYTSAGETHQDPMHSDDTGIYVRGPPFRHIYARASCKLESCELEKLRAASWKSRIEINT